MKWDSSDVVVTSGASLYSNPFLFNRRYWDAHLDMYHYRARTYDPDMGRFLSRDPLGLWGDVGNLGNGYAYVSNSPWQYSDPYGLCSWKVYDCVADGLRFIGEGTVNTVGKSTAQGIWWARDEVFDSSAEGANAAICQGGSGLAASFAPGVSTGCALGNDFGDDGVIGNQKEYHLDYALAPLDAIPGGRATNGAVTLGVFATKHVDEGAGLARRGDDGVDWVRQVASNLDEAMPAGAKPNVDWLKQNRHVPGAPGFVRGKSELLAPADDLAPFLGSGRPVVPGKSFGQAGYRESIDFGVPIGFHRGGFGGVAELTSVGTVHYSKAGFHIIPARPIP